MTVINICTVLTVSLLIINVSAHADIYQCGNLFQDKPCQGAKVVVGAPTTSNDQSAKRFAEMEAKHHAENAENAEILEKQQAARRTLVQVAPIILLHRQNAVNQRKLTELQAQVQEAKDTARAAAEAAAAAHVRAEKR